MFTPKEFAILGNRVSPENLEGMTRFPSFFEPFIKLDGSAEKEKRPKCLGARVPMPDGEYVMTEKVDGTNCSVIGWGDEKRGSSMLIRGRNELLAYSNDYLWNDKDEMVTTLVPHAGHIQKYMESAFPDALWMLCMELYGPGIGKRGAQYGAKKNARLFAARIFQGAHLKMFSEAPRDKYDSLRRVNKHVPFLPWSQVQDISSKCGLQTVPSFGTLEAKSIQSPEDVIRLLQSYKSSTTAQEDGGSVQNEGLVLWSQSDYRHPVEGEVLGAFKLKFEDYPRQ